MAQYDNNSKRSGDRREGRQIRTLNAYWRMAPYILPSMNGQSVLKLFRYCADKVSVTFPFPRSSASSAAVLSVILPSLVYAHELEP